MGVLTLDLGFFVTDQKSQAPPCLAQTARQGRGTLEFAVTRDGEVGAGGPGQRDRLEPIPRRQRDEENATPVSEITRLYVAKHCSEADARSIQRALRVAALPESWKEYFRERLEIMSVQDRRDLSTPPPLSS